MTRALAIAAALLAAGCAGLDAQSCPSGVMCGVAPPPTLVLGVELIPAANSPLVPEQVASLAFDDSGNAVVQLSPTVEIDGLVLGDDDAPVAAQIVATAPSPIPGRPDVALQTASDSKLGTFSLTLPKNDDQTYTYSLRILPQNPDDARYAPVTQTIAVYADRLSPYGGVLVCLGSGGAMCGQAHAPILVSGRVSDALDVGIGGVRVAAIDPDSGLTRSSVATTGADGLFVLRLGVDVNAGDSLRVVAQPDSSRVLPSLTRAVAAGAKDAVLLRMPALPAAQHFSLPVGGKSPAGVESTLAGARVDFSCDLSNELNDGTQALLTATVLTDDNGSAAVDLIPGTGNYNRGYTVAVTPPANSPFQRADQLALMLGPQGGVLAPVSLGLRPQVVGHLVSPGGDPVAGAVVSAQPSGQAVQLGAQDPNPLALPSALSGPDGGFSVRVDPGTYDVDLVPPAAQPLPRWSLDNRVVSTSDVDLQTVPLPMAVRARVTVLDPAGAAVDGLEMRIYSLSWPSDCPMKMQTGSCPALPARLAADAVTASDGSAQVYLPAP